jgi:retron-type reverse transcriptase
MKAQLSLTLDDIASTENLLEAWQEFVRGKRKRKDMKEFSLHLIDNILALRSDLLWGRYRHGSYQAFSICDPKPRQIHKASVRDRLLHHAIHRKLYPFFDRTFTAHSYSCRVGKGTHKALDCFTVFARKESQNHTKTVWVLKCDIRKFFASIDHETLFGILQSYIPDRRVNNLLREIIGSFTSVGRGKGLPLGNLTSQILVNIYMNEFDQFVKRTLRVKYYLRYADDFAFLSEDKEYLQNILPQVAAFLGERLNLSLHPDKVSITSFASGVDFLGWVHFPNRRVIRTATKKRMLRRIEKHPTKETVASYIGMLSHGNAKRITGGIKKSFPLWSKEG